MRWRLYIEEYSPDLRYIPGSKNVVADALSRLEKTDAALDDSKEAFYSVMQCFGKDPDNFDFHPFSFAHLDKSQQADSDIKKILRKENSKYSTQDFHGGGKERLLVCYNGKIVVPKLLHRHVIDWYHTVLCHPGINRTEESISQHLYWPKMRDQITRHVQACPTCQKNKRKVKK
jgi:hypothetical protein